VYCNGYILNIQKKKREKKKEKRINDFALNYTSYGGHGFWHVSQHVCP
jgi:hypothetical protein